MVERLPGYAPELNPTEALWGNLKGKGGELAYLAGDTLEEVIGAAQRGIDRVRRTPICRIRFFVTPDSTCGSNRHPIRQDSLSDAPLMTSALTMPGTRVDKP